MKPHVIHARDVPPQPWRNGGGQTRELLAWPRVGEWSVRVSVADITQDGPFSAFDGVTRWFAAIEGAGVMLDFPQAQHELQPGSAPLRFDGALAPGCRLLGGPTRDLNLMLRGGDGLMQPVRLRQAWASAYPWSGLFTACAGRWSDGISTLDLPAFTLLWQDTAVSAPWRFEPAGPHALAGWWLGFALGTGPSS